MAMSDKERKQKQRNREKSSGIKEIRGLKVKIEHEPLIKKKVKAFISDLEKQLAKIE